MKAHHLALALPTLIALSACATVQSQPSANSAALPTPQAKNVILFIGDGMGISTVTAARIYDGQSRGEPGEENLLSFESFPNVALVKTYNTNQQVPDSAGTASAIMTGVKTRAGVIGVGPAARRGDCAEAQANILPDAAERLTTHGKAVGIVSTARLTHATPAAVYGHLPERNWEADSNIPESERAAGCRDFATQLMDFPFDVALGGGRQNFFGKENGGKRIDPNADLPSAWSARSSGHYVTTGAAMQGAPQDGKPLLGLFSRSHMTYMLDRKADSTEPTLSQMTASAIDRLSNDPDGYFLMVESGRIDHGHHMGKAAYALSEAQELSRAVQVALDKVDLSDTLILVTADHSHVFTIAGYPTRGNPILGLVQGNDDHGEPTGKPILATDGHPYTTLGYQNGPGATPGEARSAPSGDPHGTQQALVPTGSVFDNTHRLSETHGGEDVALYATGPGSERARGVIEQNRIYDILMQAFGMRE